MGPLLARLLAVLGLAALSAAAQLPASAQNSWLPADMGDVNSEPRLDPQHRIRVPTPYGAVLREAQGSVLVNFVVRADGSVDPDSIQIDQSSGQPDLDKAVTDDARTWKFIPGKEYGQPVAKPYAWRVTFDNRPRPPNVPPPGAAIPPPRPFDPPAAWEMTPDLKFIDLSGPDWRAASEIAGIRYELQPDGSATFSRKGTDDGAWTIRCGRVEGARTCIAQAYHLEVALIDGRGWVATLHGRPASKCAIRFLPTDLQKPVVDWDAEGKFTGTARLTYPDGRRFMEHLTEMQGFATPCWRSQVTSVFRPVSFKPVRRYMEWAVTGRAG